jgi:hypothetical protein
MDFSEIKNCADKPQQKPHQQQQKSYHQTAERGRSKDKKPYENCTQSKSPSQYNKLQNNKNQFVKHGENKQPSFQRVPANSRLIEVGDKRYFDCHHCGSFHKVGKVCYLVQIAQIAAQAEQSGNKRVLNPCQALQSLTARHQQKHFLSLLMKILFMIDSLPRRI